MSAIEESILQMGRQARAAAYRLAQLSSDEKNAILRAMASSISDFSSPAIAGRYSPEPTSAIDPGICQNYLPLNALRICSAAPLSSAGIIHTLLALPFAIAGSCWRY